MTLPSSIGGVATEEVGYFDCHAATLTSWMLKGLGVQWKESVPHWESLIDATVDLAVTRMLSKYACIPVNGWTLLLSNGPLGTDVGVLPSRAARELGCRAVRAVDSVDGHLYRACILDIYGSDGVAPLALRRSIVAADDGGRWVFETSGNPFPFEETDAYLERKKADRFTREMLIRYLRKLGVPVGVEPKWKDAVLIERQM